jgi:hypothetical protein
MTNDLISPDLRLTVIYTVFSCSLYTICALLQISLMQLCRLARHFWTDALVPYRENIFSGIFFRRSGFATVRHENGSFLRDQSIAIEFPAGGVREPFRPGSPGQDRRYLTIFPIVRGSGPQARKSVRTVTVGRIEPRARSPRLGSTATADRFPPWVYRRIECYSSPTIGRARLRRSTCDKSLSSKSVGANYRQSPQL